MSGADIVAAIALGARFTLVGRAYLYGLMAGGEAGVHRAVEILSGQLTRTMKLLGVTCLEELSPSTSRNCDGWFRWPRRTEVRVGPLWHNRMYVRFKRGMFAAGGDCPVR